MALWPVFLASDILLDGSVESDHKVMLKVAILFQ